MRWFLCSALVVCATVLGACSSERRCADFRVSLSVSPYAESMFAQGITFTDGSLVARDPAELQPLYVAHGATEVYARIETRRYRPVGVGEDETGIHSLERGLARARIAAQLGLPFNPELGLFANYGDMRYQPAPDFSDFPQIQVPGPWTDLGIEQMVPILRTYGRAVATEILRTGVRVNMWDLGNEAEFGVAGVAVRPEPEDAELIGYRPPDAIDPEIGRMTIPDLLALPEEQQVTWLRTHLWPANARMFAAVADGIREVDPQARFSTHVSAVTTRPAVYVAYFEAMRDGGYLPDVLGFSYYPTIAMDGDAPDRLQGFKDTVTAAHRALRRPVFIAEFGYAATEAEMFLWPNEPVAGYPLTPEGQADFTAELIRWGRAEGLLAGIRPWAPELVTGWGPMALFEQPAEPAGGTARSRPALDVLHPTC